MTKIMVPHPIRVQGTPMIDGPTKKNVISRMKRIEGQMRGVNRMVEEEKYCIDVIRQIHAAKKALEQVSLMLIRQHVRTCLTEAIMEKKGGSKTQELINTLDQFLR